MKVVVLARAGAPCAARTVLALQREGIRVQTVADGDRLPTCDAVIVPTPIPAAAGHRLVRAVARGVPVLGFGDGFAALCEAELLPGRLLAAKAEFVCRSVHLRVEGRPTPFTAAIPAGRVLRLPLASATPRYAVHEPEALVAEGRVLLRYCDAAGGLAPDADPTGSDQAIAGICNPAGNLVGLTPHLDWDALLGGPARQFFAALRLDLRR